MTDPTNACQPIPADRKWLNVAESRIVSGRGVGRIREALRSGELRGYKGDGVAGHWKINRDDLDAWVRGEKAPLVVPEVTRRRSA